MTVDHGATGSDDPLRLQLIPRHPVYIPPSAGKVVIQSVAAGSVPVACHGR